MVVGGKKANDSLPSYFFLNQQFITWSTVADCGSYFIATYKRHRLHDEKETNERER